MVRNPFFTVSKRVLTKTYADVFQPGVIATTISLVIALLSLFFILLLLLPHRDSSRSPLSTRTLPFQFGSLGFFTLWLFTVMIPFTQFFRTRSAKITAFVGPVQLPAASIAQAEQALGATTVYKHIHYRENSNTLIDT